jgi:hypothetical protein
LPSIGNRIGVKGFPTLSLLVKEGKALFRSNPNPFFIYHHGYNLLGTAIIGIETFPWGIFLRMVIRYPTPSKPIEIGAKPDAIYIRNDGRDMVIGEEIFPIDAFPIIDLIHGLALGRIGFVNLLRFVIEGGSSAIRSKPDLLTSNSNHINHFA